MKKKRRIENIENVNREIKNNQMKNKWHQQSQASREK